MGEGGAIHAFYGKVAYGPGDAGDIPIEWKQGCMVWMVRAQVDSSGGSSKTQVVHQYVDPIRLAGLQVSKSGEYEFLHLATPRTPQEDADLFLLHAGLNATLLNHQQLESQQH